MTDTARERLIVMAFYLDHNKDQTVRRYVNHGLYIKDARVNATGLLVTFEDGTVVQLEVKL